MDGELEVQEIAAPKPPLVIDLRSKPKSKRKRRYSRGLAEIQETERHLVRASHRLANAITEGLGEYRKRRLKSARQKKDGAMRDFIPNSSRALSKALKTASKLPDDLARALDTPQNRKRIRRQLKQLDRSLRR